ncbi:unnamed protein product [Mycena citricolor]|uniref:Uncharacterized protein n=1 Tax=Mycena citricolor TaxID=2018698 RepID=A0AAD2H710_9AGAR|nr:unnamed protein product [Mycena citricolor]
MAVELPSHPPALFPTLGNDATDMVSTLRSTAPVLPHRLTPLDHRSSHAEHTARPRAKSSGPIPPIRQRTRTLSSLAANPRHPPFLRAAKQPRVLAMLLACSSWATAWALFNTCRDIRDFIYCPELRDVILSRFVPDYAACLRVSDPRRLTKVPIALTELNTLMISRAMPLHRFPMHALTCVSGLLPNVDDLEREETRKLTTFALVHTRFVLLLQSLAHSSILSPPPEQHELTLRLRPEPRLRQLNFPPPLSHKSASEPSPVSRGRKNSVGSRKSSDSVRSDTTSLVTRSLSRPANRLSIFRTGSKAPPPPASEPRSLRHYTSGWRHALQRASGSFSDDEWGRKKPLERAHRRLASVNLSSGSSSLSSPSPPFSRDSTVESSPIRRDVSTHDLSLATQRTRAPILRVFVPCTEMERDDEEGSIAQCEDQLYDAGLWPYLSLGDIVCNFGYVPPASPDVSDGSLPDATREIVSRSTWLLFDGRRLVPYSPPESLPLSDPTMLPSPFYFIHIIPPLSDPLFTVRGFPACDDIPQLTLVTVSAKVRSPHSPLGYALVKKSAWTARVWRRVAQDDEMGQGWQGEWILEADGTLEGQRILVNCLRGVTGPYRQWQIVREKCAGDRLYLRLIKTFASKRSTISRLTNHASQMTV